MSGPFQMAVRMDERQAMESFLAVTPCPKCGGAMELTGETYYTNPGSWVCRCSCGGRGLVGYTGIPVIDWSAEMIAEYDAIGTVEGKVAYFVANRDKGVVRPRAIRFTAD